MVVKRIIRLASFVTIKAELLDAVPEINTRIERS
jgi:hypothetical protein